MLSQACAQGCYFCTHPHESPCCHGSVCKAPESARVKEVTKLVDKLVASGKVKVKVGPDGKVIFEGLPDMTLHQESPEAVIKQLKLYGSPAAKMALQRAEQLSGRRMVIS